jgi:hypothetical protein
VASDIVDRRYVSRYSQPGLGITVHKAGVLADADALPEVSLVREGLTTPEWTREATRDSLGTYSVLLSSAETQTPGLATLMWDYATDTIPQVYGLDIEIGQSAPAYDALPEAWKTIIEAVWVRFADLFDSPFGGPHLQVYIQTRFGRQRMAQLLNDALGTLNAASAPHASYALGGQDFPMIEWGTLLSESLYIEVIKHLIRSYTEQPEVILGQAVSRLDRRDYLNRWQEILNMETADFERDLGRYRKANMGLGNFSVLVAGGAYGNWGPEINPGGVGAAAARGYFYVGRWH